MLASFVVQIALLAVPAPDAAPAEFDPKVEAALELMELSNADRMFEAMKPQLAQLMEQQISELAPCAASRPVAEAIGKEFGDMFAETMNVERLKIDAAAIYAEVFTLEELNDVLAFYRSPAGAKLMEKMPELVKRNMQLTQTAMSEFQPKIVDIMQRHSDDLKAASRACAAEAGAKEASDARD
jgi:hypothetical protein